MVATASRWLEALRRQNPHMHIGAGTGRPWQQLAFSPLTRNPELLAVELGPHGAKFDPAAVANLEALPRGPHFAHVGVRIAVDRHVPNAAAVVRRPGHGIEILVDNLTAEVRPG